jgi:hypothetical protein
VIDDGVYYLRAERFQAAASAGDVYREAERLLLVINGSGALSDPGFKRVRIDGIVELLPDGSRRRSLFVSGEAIGRGSMTARISVIKRDGTMDESNEASTVRLIERALSDRDAAEALEILGCRDQDPVNLYKVFEIIRHAAGGEMALLKKPWAPTKEQLSRFTRSACHPAVAGPKARHARDKNEPPADPMILDEMRGFIRELLRGWLNEEVRAS